VSSTGAHAGGTAPLFSVVVVNWDRAPLLAECLGSLALQSFQDFETIVVDNGSRDGSRDVARRAHARLVELPENRGFAGGANAGIAVARGRYVALINNDAVAEPGWLAALAGATRRHPVAGMFASKIVSREDPTLLDNVGHLLYPDGLNRGHGRLERDVGQYGEEREALFPSGCAAVYSRELLDRVGWFEESFFAYGDDTDLGLRGRWAGFSCVYVPSAVVRHRYSGSSDAYSDLKAYHVERNRVLVLLRCFPLREVLLSPLWTLLRHALQLYGLLSGKGAAARYAEQRSGWSLLWTALRAYAGAVRLAPAAIAARARIRATRRISTRDFRRLIRRFRLPAREVALRD
jgi:GT2 family glycosyltransferase